MLLTLFLALANNILCPLLLSTGSYTELNQTTNRMPLRPSEKLITSIVKENGNSASTLPEPLPEQFIKINHLSAILRDMGFELPFASTQSNDAFILTEVSRIIHELENSDISAVVIKSIPAISKPIGDVDILVDDLEKAGEILINNSYDVKGSYPNSHKLIGVSIIDGILVNIHLHGEIAWRRVIYLNSKDVLKSATERVFHELSFPVPSPEFEVLITAAHMLHERGNMRISLHNVLELSALFSSKNISIPLLFETASQNGWGKSLLLFLKSANAIHYQFFHENFSISEPDFFNSKITLPYNPLFFNWTFPIKTMALIRFRKLFHDFTSKDFSSTSNGLRAYPFDILKVITERYGVINTKRRLNKWKNTIRSII
tara:strand:+ start:416 stop:1537 length:1122 start_codon:yes stop_codon:yes gene_type:complete